MHFKLTTIELPYSKNSDSFFVDPPIIASWKIHLHDYLTLARDIQCFRVRGKNILSAETHSRTHPFSQSGQCKSRSRLITTSLYLLVKSGKKQNSIFTGFFVTDLQFFSWIYNQLGLSALRISNCQLTLWRSVSKQPCAWIFIFSLMSKDQVM